MTGAELLIPGKLSPALGSYPMIQSLGKTCHLGPTYMFKEVWFLSVLKNILIAGSRVRCEPANLDQDHCWGGGMLSPFPSTIILTPLWKGAEF